MMLSHLPLTTAFGVLTLLTAGALAQTPLPAAQAPSAPEPVCFGRQNQPVAFLDSELRDQLEIEVDSAVCADAVALVTLEARDGRLLVTDSFPLEDLSRNGAPEPEDLHPILADFISNVRQGDAREIAPYGETVTTLSREIYQRAREDGGAVVCFPVDTQMLRCVWHDGEADETRTLFTMAY